MSIRAVNKRYLLIIEHINSPAESTLKNIIKNIKQKGIKYSIRTFNRDLEALRDEFGVEIVYNRPGNCYTINKEESLNFDTFYRFLETTELANLVHEKTKGKGKISNYIATDNKKHDTKGSELLAQILNAIIDRKIISFTYGKYYGDTTKKNRRFRPYFLKEYNYRWYVAGFEPNKNTHRVFSLDRMEQLIITEETFKWETQKEEYLKNGFENTVGLAFNYHKLQDVKLWLDKEQYNYAKSQPFHASQKLIGEDEKGYTISLKVHPNVELRLLIVKHGAHVKVLEPKWFADELKEIHRDAAGLYL